jgi:hypothetical protein
VRLGDRFESACAEDYNSDLGDTRRGRGVTFTTVSRIEAAIADLASAVDA